MRVERKGHVQKLTPLVERFLVEALRGVCLDDPENSEQRRVDYSCLNGLLAIEIKSLEDDASERMNNLTDELRKRGDWPVFLGSAPMQSFVRHLEDSEQVERKVLDRMGRAIKNHIHKANKQLEAHSASNSRKNIVRVVFIINEDHEIYDPKTVAFIVQRLLLREEKGELLYPFIDAVVFKSERHVTAIDRQMAFPIVSIEGAPIEQAVWKRDVLNLMLRRWGEWNGRPVHYVDDNSTDFDTIDHIPEEMKRYEKWQLDYRRNRYMERFTHDELRNRFDEIMAISTLKFVKGSPETPIDEAVTWSMSSMSHIMLEMGWRGTPITDFPQEPIRLALAAKRLGFGEDVVNWLKKDLANKKGNLD